jgi:hypothetical protein
LASVKVDITGDKEVLALLERLPKLVVSSGGPIDKAVRKASTIVAKRARQLAPDSKKNPEGNSREKQSDKSKGIWQKKLKETIRHRIIKYDTATWAVVGPKNPEGNMANFIQEKPRRHVLWGKATAIKQFRDTRNWITKAFDETKGEQLSAVQASLKSDIDANMKS